MHSSPITVADLAKAIDGEAVGKVDLKITRPNEPHEAQKDEIALAADPKFLDALTSSAARAAILPADANWQDYGLDAAILVRSARRTMVDMSKLLEVPWSRHWACEPIHPTAIIDPSAKIGKDVLIGPFCVIAEGVQIDEGTVIHDQVTIAQDVIIGANCQIYSGTRLGPEVHLGNEVIIQSNSVIGGDGFSYLTPNQEAIRDARNSGNPQQALSGLKIERINSLGSVRIGDQVELGACVNIDRGTLKHTSIGAGTKIDNQVQIGHNAQIGQNCLICGQAGVAGSAQIGDRSIIGGASAISDNITIGEDVIVAGMSGVNTNVPAQNVVMGNPAFKMLSNIESYKLYRRLPRLAARVKDLETKLQNKDSNNE